MILINADTYSDIFLDYNLQLPVIQHTDSIGSTPPTSYADVWFWTQD